ncbi:MAG: PAS domain-containing protein [Myxococcales bacterium]
MSAPVDVQDLLRSAFDSALSAILVLDLDGRIVDCNATCWRTLGLMMKSELVGQRASALTVNHAEVGSQLAAVMSDGQARKFECVVKIGDAPVRVLDLAVSAHRSPQGRLLGLVAVANDVAERKRTTESLRLVNDLAIDFAAAPATADLFEEWSPRGSGPSSTPAPWSSPATTVRPAS